MAMNVNRYGGYYESEKYRSESAFRKEHPSNIDSEEYEAVLKEKDPELLGQLRSLTSRLYHHELDGKDSGELREAIGKASAYVFEARREASGASAKEAVSGTRDTSGTARLSDKAKRLLEKLRKTYGDIDFMVADFEKGDDAKRILSRGTREFSVLFSVEELEKMASDEKYEQEYMNGVKGAIRMSEQINAQFGYESAFGKDADKAEVTRIGIAFHKDGTMSFFAELEKSSEKQRERIEESRKERAEERRKAQKEQRAERTHRDTPVKRATVQASSREELIKKMNGIDWRRISEEEQDEGSRFDFSV